MGRKATKSKTIFMIQLTECLISKGEKVDRFNGGGTSPDGIRIKYQVPHLTIETTLIIGIYGQSERQKLPPYKEKWYCNSIRYEESGTHTRYGHTFTYHLGPHELSEFIYNRFLQDKIILTHDDTKITLGKSTTLEYCDPEIENKFKQIIKQNQFT